MLRNLSIRLIIGLVMAAVAYFSYRSQTQINPVTGEAQQVSLTPEQEVAMGLQSAPQMAQEFGGLYPDEAVQENIKKIGMNIVNSTDARKSPYQFDFHILKDDQTINAFALPGGQIFMTMGLLKLLKTEDQVAGVIGHEIGHVVGRHSAQQMAKQELMQGLAGAATVAMSDGMNNSGAVAQYVANFLNLKYGREDELEADRFGISYLQATGYNPAEMIGVMEILAASAGGQRPSEMSSTHPYPETRIAQIRRILDQKKIQEMER